MGNSKASKILASKLFWEPSKMPTRTLLGNLFANFWTFGQLNSLILKIFCCC